MEEVDIQQDKTPRETIQATIITHTNNNNNNNKAHRVEDHKVNQNFLSY